MNRNVVVFGDVDDDVELEDDEEDEEEEEEDDDEDDEDGEDENSPVWQTFCIHYFGK